MSLQPTIAACLMVRNEAEHLRRCLASLAGAVDTIHVTDTGSTDNTVAVARSFGAEVRSFAWCDDFAAARNASLTGVTADWLLVLDADDAFPSGEALKLRGELAADACAATVRYVVSPTHTPLRTVKLLRHGLGARYEGIIHESPDAWLAEQWRAGWRLQHLPVTLLHHGYTPAAMPGKTARNLPLLHREWERLQPSGSLASRLHIGAELGLALAHTGQLDAAAGWLDQRLREATASAPVLVAPALKVLTSLLWVLGEAGRSEAALTAVRSVETPLAALPAYQLQRGLTELASGQHTAALEWLERFRAAWTEHELDTPVPVEFTGPKLMAALTQCHIGRRDYVTAATCCRRWLELTPDDPEPALRLRVAEQLQTL